LNEIDGLQELYDMARKSIERAKGAKLTASQAAEVERRKRLMQVIAADISRLQHRAGDRQPS
jgi:hypothetical protein